MRMKKPEMEIIQFENEDVIATSQVHSRLHVLNFQVFLMV